MLRSFERLVALRYLRARKQEGFVSVIAGFSFLGIMLGVATLIVVMAVMNGFRAELVSRLLGLEGHYTVFRIGSDLTDYKELAERLRAEPFVTQAAPLIDSQALITRRDFATGVLLRGMRPEDLQAKDALAQGVLAGSLQGLDRGSIAIGDSLAQRLVTQVGDRLVLISPQGKPGPFGTMPRQGAYEIAAIFDVGMYEYDANVVFMSLDGAQAFLGLGDVARSIEVMVADPDLAVRDTAQHLANLAAPDAFVSDWRSRNEGYLGALAVERNVMFLILSLIILVAAFNIISGMIMLVKDKGRDIAILRTMGATTGAVLRIFMLTGALIGVVGTLGGMALGLLVADNIEAVRQAIQFLTGAVLFPEEVYFLAELPARIDWGEVIAVGIMALTLSLLATLYPAWRAARLDPVEALRYQ